MPGQVFLTPYYHFRWSPLFDLYLSVVDKLLPTVEAGAKNSSICGCVFVLIRVRAKPGVDWLISR
jgi:hypothetical protein